MAIEPLETDFGRKRVINQSSCNKDFSCVEGFCPSFVTVSGAQPRRLATEKTVVDASHLADPVLPVVDGSWAVLVSGIGGAGVVTVGQTLAVAAHADGYFSSNLDITGLAQKYGAVHSHIKIARAPETLNATRIATGEADALIGCDLVVAAGDEALSKLNADTALAVTDTTIVPTADFAKNPDLVLNGDEQLDRMHRVIGDRAHGIAAQSLAAKVLGDAVFANMVLIGAAWQSGALPLSRVALDRAIELNGVKIPQNIQAFDLGRLMIADPSQAAKLAGDTVPVDLAAKRGQSLDEIITLRTTELTAYQNSAYAKRYNDMIKRVQAAGLDDAAVTAVARNYYKLLATKDEWEVARLYSKPEFKARLKDAFDGDLKLTFHVGAWPFGRIDKVTGKPIKGEAGQWMLTAFGIMSRMRGLRGSLLDPFRNSSEAHLSRQLLAEYEADIDFASTHAAAADAQAIADLLDLPEHIRGYGNIRERHAKQVAETRRTLREKIASPSAKAA